jgi:uncharacterized membrane protein YdbT with pleckstrin-like domain
MNYKWDSYLSSGEKINADFGVSNFYSGGVLFVITVVAIILSFTNFFVGLGVFLLGILYWGYLSRGKRYAFTNKRIIIVDLFLGKHLVNINYDKITDISIEQNSIDLIGGWGSILINTAGSNYAEAILENVDNPLKFKNLLDELSEPERKKR